MITEVTLRLVIDDDGDRAFQGLVTGESNGVPTRIETIEFLEEAIESFKKNIRSRSTRTTVGTA